MMMMGSIIIDAWWVVVHRAWPWCVLVHRYICRAHYRFDIRAVRRTPFRFPIPRPFFRFLSMHAGHYVIDLNRLHACMHACTNSSSKKESKTPYRSQLLTVKTRSVDSFCETTKSSTSCKKEESWMRLEKLFVRP